MEYIEVLDERGNPTGEIKSKSEIHRDGDLHRAVHIWIVNPKGELLIQKRAATKENYPNSWDISCAGHVSTGEVSIVAAAREMEEEIGITLSQKHFEFLFTAIQKGILNNGTYIDNEFDDIYLVRLDIDQSKLKLQKEEVSEVKFISPEELEKLIESGDKSFVPHPAEYGKLFKELRKRPA